MKSAIKFFLNLFPRPWLIKLSYIFIPIFDIIFKGNRYQDPINQKKYRNFLPYGYGKGRKNALSPGTLSLERHRLMWLYLKNHTTFFTENLKVLHLAPEQCFHSIFKKMKNLSYTTADLYSPIVDVKADILSLPFEDNSFDVLFCNHVLEHIEDDKKAMNEIFRVLKPKGWAILQVPIQLNREKTYEDFSITSPEERKKHFGQYDHVRWYGKDYYERLETIGFQVIKWKVSEHFSKDEIDKYVLSPTEILPIVVKS